MDKQEVTGWLFTALDKPDAPFSGVMQDDTSDALIVQTAAGERFRISAAPLEDGGETGELQTYKNFFTICMGMMLMQMKSQRIVSVEEYNKIWSRVSGHGNVDTPDLCGMQKQSI